MNGTLKYIHFKNAYYIIVSVLENSESNSQFFTFLFRHAIYRL